MPTCSQAKCPVATTGVCLEGHKQGCPHLQQDTSNQDVSVADTLAADEIQSIEPSPYFFHSGEKLTALEASRMMSSMRMNIVLCAGAKDAGKTTFLARIGEMFRDGTFKNYRFAGSKTLCAFEKVSWPATILSGAGRPETVRSYTVEKDTFFHIRVQPVGNPDVQTDILISDLPGETFHSAIATMEICMEQLALAHADHLVLFLDCHCLVDTAKRHPEKDNIFNFLERVKKIRHDPKDIQVQIFTMGLYFRERRTSQTRGILQKH